jgi:DNA-binding beta-propeller fold protein YncE
MKSIMTHTTVMSGAKAAVLGLALISLVNCSSSDDTTPQVAAGGSAGLSSPLVFVNNTGDKTLTSVALKGDSGNAVVGTIPAAEFENVALGDMQFSYGDWLFLNLGAANKVATIDPLTAATPVHESNLAAGTRPVHLYRDLNDGEVVWVMNDGDNAGGTLTPGDDLVNCAGAQGGGSVTAFHNSHLGPGGTPPRVLGTTCLLADGHKVATFSSGAGVPKRVFVTSEDAGEMAVIDDDEASATYRKMINRIDLCNSAKETTPCNNESATPLTTAFTPNSSLPHGIRWSKLTKKVYSILEGYHNIVEIDPTTLAITKTFDLTGTPYTGYGISPDGRFLLLRGDTTPPTGTKLGVIDLGIAATPRTDFTIPELDGTSTGSFKFSPDGKRFYILAGNTAASTKKDRLFAFDASTLTATPPVLTLIKEIQLVAGGDSVGFNAAHSIDVLAQGAGEAKYIVVSNKADNSLSIINATDNLIKQTVTNVGSLPGSVIVYAPGTAAAGNQATASLTGGSQAKSSALPDQLDDHGMPN